MKGLHRDVSQWRWAAPVYIGIKISNGVRDLEHKNSQTTEYSRRRDESLTLPGRMDVSSFYVAKLAIGFPHPFIGPLL
jgi:hypothetical protein